MADPQGVLVADAAARAVEFVGLPEAALNLAHAVVYLATAPKSNRITVALDRARAEVPAHLREAHYPGARGLGHGEGYQYPHDDPSGRLAQQYRPADASGDVYYEPSPHGVEKQIHDAWLSSRPKPPQEPCGDDEEINRPD